MEEEFHNEMINVHRLICEKTDYNARRFLQMVNFSGGVRAAKELLCARDIPDGLCNLALAGRLDLSMEALVLQERWASLFNEDELQLAKNRLRSLGYEI